MQKRQRELVPLACVDKTKGFVKHYQSEEVVMIPKDYHPKEEELRAAWIATVGHIDLPLCESKEMYQKTYIQALDEMVEYNMNTVYVQIRPMNDAFYKSSLNPYSRYLCGGVDSFIEGKDPQWDVLGFFVEEAHKRDLEFHAWLNPYRVTPVRNIETEKMSEEEIIARRDEELAVLHPLNYAKIHPEMLVMSKGGQLVFDPGLPEVRKFIVDSIDEIIQNYPIDGFHFDDYFYPSDGLCPKMDDRKSYEQYGQGMTLEDYRRDSVTALVRDLKKLTDEHNQKDRNILFGISPFAIYRNKASDPSGSNTKGSEAYSKWYADLKLWVEEEMIHYIVPQIYWDFEHPVAPHADVLDWWSALMKDSPVKLFIGIPFSRFKPEITTVDRTMIPNMLKYAQKDDVVDGFVVWNHRMIALKGNEEREATQEMLKEMWKSPAKRPTYPIR